MTRTNILLLASLLILLSACGNETKRTIEQLNETRAMSVQADSMLEQIKTEIRIINNQISEMVDLNIDRDLLGSFVDAYKEKERKFKRWSEQWGDINNQVNTSQPDESFSGDAAALKASGQSLNDSLSMLSQQMKDISTQAFGILENAKKAVEETSAEPVQ